MAHELSSVDLDFAFYGLDEQDIEMILKNVKIQKGQKSATSECDRYLYYHTETK
jgi:hypothetical protein